MSINKKFPAISRQGIAVRFRAAFPRHGIAQTSLALLIWLTEKVCFRTTFPRHGIAQTSLALLIWLTEKVQSFQYHTHTLNTHKQQNMVLIILHRGNLKQIAGNGIYLFLLYFSKKLFSILYHSFWLKSLGRVYR